MGYLMLILSPTRHNPKAVDLAISLVKDSGRPLLAVFVLDTKVTDVISNRIVDVGFLGDKVSSQLQAAILRDYEDRGRKELDEVKQRAEQEGIQCKTLIGKGDFVEQCLRIAGQEICRFDLMQETPVLFKDEQKNDAQEILKQERKILGELVYKFRRGEV